MCCSCQGAARLAPRRWALQHATGWSPLGLEVQLTVLRVQRAKRQFFWVAIASSCDRQSSDRARSRHRWVERHAARFDDDGQVLFEHRPSWSAFRSVPAAVGRVTMTTQSLTTGRSTVPSEQRMRKGGDVAGRGGAARPLLAETRTSAGGRACRREEEETRRDPVARSSSRRSVLRPSSWVCQSSGEPRSTLVGRI